MKDNIENHRQQQAKKNALPAIFCATLLLALSPYLTGLISGKILFVWPKWYYDSYFLLVAVAFINLFMKMKWLNVVLGILNVITVFGVLFLGISS